MASILGDGEAYELVEWLNSIELPFEFIIGKALSSPTHERLWADAVRVDPRFYNPASRKVIRDILASGSNAEVAQKLSQVIDAYEQRERDQSSLAPGRDQRSPGAEFRSRQRCIEDSLLLATVDVGADWIDLARFLNFDEDSQNWALEYLLVETPGWLEADARVRASVCDVAVQFLKRIPQRYENTFYFDEFSVGGFQALQLLVDARDPELESLSTDEWAYWVPAIVHSGSAFSDLAVLQRLMNEAYSR